MSLKFVINQRTPTAEEYNAVRLAAGLSVKDPLAAAVGLKNSLYAVCAYSGDKLAGIGRVVGDGGVYFHIVDLAIFPEFQGQGLGKSIMEELMKYIMSHARSGSFISLFSNKGLIPFYQKFGFQAREADAPGMSQMIKSV